MKKLLLIMSLAAFGAACDNAESSDTETTQEATATAEPEAATEESKNVDRKEKDKGEQANSSTWDKLLKDHVSDDGEVDYGGMLDDKADLEAYLAEISKNAPAKNWSDEEKMAYWINAYNAFTVKLILDNKGVSSIKDIGPKTQIPFVNTPWDIKFIEIDGDKYDLNNIEHGILRKDFKKDPRYHFALVCAAESCPKLRNEAYTAKKLDKQLDEEGEAFLNNKAKNKISEDGVTISPLFKWYKKDFERKMPIAEWVNKYSDEKIDKKQDDFNYMDYSWKLNGTF
ncbi:DUF547 domain-containing protein [uncultured Arcticibacterium sp.]|uniref:DUF547 domain-containing protein n=1 Tax=uncultured Arcticibacterium sp. TaxID=2173042 RepID=UPI0030FBD7AA